MSKFRNIKTTVDGIKFDSKKEANRYTQLRFLESAGEITNLELQPKFVLIGASGEPLTYDNGRKMVYIADFKYTEWSTGQEVIEDVKGHKTAVYKIKKSIMKSMGYTVTEI